MPRHLPLAALLTAGAGATHLAAAVPHFSGNAVYGALFVGAGWLQLLLAALLLASAQAGVAWTAVGVNAAAIVAWAISRTTGLPFAHVEPVLLGDALTVALEVAAIGVLVARLRGANFGVRAGYVSAGSLLAVLALAVGGSTVAIADLGTEGHGHGTESEEAGGHGGSGGHGAEESPGGEVAQVADSAHEHDDGTVHLHQAGQPHVHGDDTVHLHGTTETGPGGGRAPEQDDGHDHEHEDDEGH